MATAEVLPIVLEGQDNTASAWSSFVRNAKGGQSAIDQLKASITGLSSGSTTSLSTLGSAARLLANPYVAVTAAILAMGGAGLSAARELAQIGDAADAIKTKASNVAGLADQLKRVGGSTEDAISGLKNLRTQLDLNARDGGYLENLFKLNGSSITDAAGKLKPIEQIYSQISGYIVNAANDTERLDIATNAYGSQAGPAMAKAALAGADSFERIAKVNIDPLIRQSQELERVWNGINNQGDGWWSSLKNRLAEGTTAWALFAAQIGGSKRAIESIYLMGNENARRAIDASGAADFYNGVRGKEGATVTPSSRTPQSTAAFDKATVAVAKLTAETLASVQAVDLGSGALEQMKTQAKLLATAEESGLTVTDAMRSKIAGLAQGAGDAADALARAKAASDINFSRGTAFLTPQDVAIATSLKTIYGTDIPAALNSWQAAQMRVNDTLKEVSSLGQDVNKGMFVDLETNLRNGQTGFQALQNAASTALGKIADKLASMAADNLWQNAFGGSSGTSILSLLGLGGGGAGAAVGPTSLNGAPLSGYDGGGYTGAGGKYVPAGIVHKGEVVFSQDDVASLGGVRNVERIRRGYATGGTVGDITPADIAGPSGGGSSQVHVSVGVAVDDAGNLQAYVKDVSRQAANDGIQGFVSSPAFVGHVATAATKARAQRKLI